MENGVSLENGTKEGLKADGTIERRLTGTWNETENKNWEFIEDTNKEY